MINKILSKEVSWYYSISDTIGCKKTEINSILWSIKTGGNDGMIATQIARVRAEKDKKKRRELKKKLPVIMWQGQFSKRAKEGLLSLSGLLCMDIDHLSETEIVRLRSSLSTIPWIFSVFLSPSGDGLKVLVKTSVTTSSDYENCYCQLMDYFHTTFHCKVDENCKDISRGCYASFDPEIHVANNVTDFPYIFDPKYIVLQNTETTPLHKVSSPLTQISKASIFLNQLQTQIHGLSDHQIIDILDKTFSRYPDNYTDGHRTRSIFAQASKLCHAGIELSEALSYLKNKFIPTGYDICKLEYETKRAYEKNYDRFGSERGQYRSYQAYKDTQKTRNRK